VIPTPSNPPSPAWPVYAALGISLLGNLLAVIGWFVGHHLTKTREAERDKRIKDEAVAAKAKQAKDALALTPAESQIIRKCAAPEGYERGRAWLMRVDSFGVWVRAGENDFFDQFDRAFQTEYLDAFESLLGRGFFRHESGDLYAMTSIGFQRANEENEQDEPRSRR
jgi:hypothetical protein